jgi:hypothetical protein
VPTQVNFDLLFAPVNGQWRLFGISVGVGSSAPAAPEPPPPPVAQKQPVPNGTNANGAKQPHANAAKPPAPAVKLTPPENKPADNQQPK